MGKGLDFKKLRDEVTKAARKSFAAVRKKNAAEQFYAFALYTDGSAMTIVPAANSEEALQRKLKKAGKVSAQNKKYYRWATAEWGYEAAEANPFNAICEKVAAKDNYDVDDDDAFEAFFDDVFDTMIQALKALDEEGFFGTGQEREQIVLFCSVSDFDDVEELENKSARLLNPKSVYKRFATRWK